MSNLGKKRERESQEEEDKITFDKNENEVEFPITFVLTEVQDENFHMLKMYVINLIDGSEFNSSELADQIVAQKAQIGTVIRTEIEGGEEEDEEDEEEESDSVIEQEDTDDSIFGITSLVKFDGSKSYEKQLLDYYRGKAKKNKEKFNKNMEGKKVALFVNERAINIPLELVPGIYGCLAKELDNFKAVDLVLLISKFVKENGEKNKEEKVLYHPEESQLIDKAVFTFDYGVPLNDEAEMNIQSTFKTVSLVKFDDFKKVVKKIAKE